jgi:HSP20 family protein
MLERFERQWADEVAQRAPFAELTAREDADKVVLTAELPGVSASALEVTVKDRTLRIEAKASADTPQGYETRRKERSSYSFSRELTLSDKVDVEGIKAALKDGVLSVTLPKRAEPQAKKITISTT